MNIEIDKEVLRLGQHQNVALNGADGPCIHVHWGRLWVTRNGDLKDYIVNSGESLAIDRTGTTLVTAMSESGLSVMQRCRSATDGTDNVSLSTIDEISNDMESAAGSLEIVYPSIEEIDSRIARAKQLRARYFADALRRAWDAVRRIFVAPAKA